MVTTLVLAGMMALGLAADEPAYDPTDPSQVAESESKSGDAADDLSGPAIEPDSMGRPSRGGGQMQPGMMAGVSVEALLEARCANCHGQQKQKAGVQVVPVEAMFTGPERDWVVVPGKPQQSSLLERIALPDGHDDIMPPDGQPLTTEQVAAIEKWIAQGAKPEAAREGGGLPRTGRSGRQGSRQLPMRAWMAAYMELDLTPEQRSTARDSTQELQRSIRKFRDTYGAQMEELQKKIRGYADRSNPTEELLKLRQELQALQAKQPEAKVLQEQLWNGLTPQQQEVMRKALEQRTRRDGRDNGRRGRGNRRGESPAEDGMDEATRKRLRLLLEERRKARQQDQDADSNREG
ncbi:MAG: hypothetical protein MK116_05240 [Phycisphaerales bacterium]|nr:hypothetical protein [Phycisphaerales bacterium]